MQKSHGKSWNLKDSKENEPCVVCLVAWLLNSSEAGGHLVLTQTLLGFCSVYHFVPMLTSLHLTTKSEEVCAKARTPPALE